MGKKERSKLRRSALLHGAIFPRINAPLFAPNNPAICLFLEHRAQKPRHPAQEEKGQNCYAIFPRLYAALFAPPLSPTKKPLEKPGTKKPGSAKKKTQHKSQKAKTATPPAVLAGGVRKCKANPHALPSLP